MQHAESTSPTLQALKAWACSVAIDDFGTGYSSLSYLRQFPIDALKIDQSFVHEISAEPRAAPIVCAVISMGRSLGHRVIAEGVETQEQLAFLQAQQCGEGQGYYFQPAAGGRTVRQAAGNVAVGDAASAYHGQSPGAVDLQFRVHS